jgi:hypothetical protein
MSELELELELDCAQFLAKYFDFRRFPHFGVFDNLTVQHQA